MSNQPHHSLGTLPSRTQLFRLRLALWRLKARKLRLQLMHTMVKSTHAGTRRRSPPSVRRPPR